jgi:uncharacterized MAPEG superfamily protein
MTSELTLLALYGIFTLLTIAAQATAAMAQVGTAMMMKSREDMPALTGLAGRMDRAQANAITALALITPAILILAQKGVSTPTTILAAQVFLAARVAYVLTYAMGIAGLRTLVWTVGVAATLVLYWAGL